MRRLGWPASARVVVLGIFILAVSSPPHLAGAQDSLAPTVRTAGESPRQAGRGPRFLSVSGSTVAVVDALRTPALRRRVALDLNGAEIPDALAEITRQTGIHFTYGKSVLEGKGRVYLKTDGITVAAALTEALLDEGVDAVVSSQTQVVLVKRVAAPQQRATISGQVTDSATRGPIPDATVMVQGTRLATRTGADGRYRLAGVTLGEQSLTARRIGYASLSRSVNVVDPQTTLDFALRNVPVELDAVVSTATGLRTKRELGNTVAQIDAATLTQTAPITSVQDLLNARAPGVNVLQNSGTLGQGARIRIRGISSVSLTSDPLVYIDGVRVEASNPSLTGGASIGTSVRPSFLNDLNPDDIETIEVVKGPSAASLYGTQAANGVIVVTTKRGRTGSPRWRLSAEQGVSQDPLDYPGQYFNEGTDADGNRVDCLEFQQALGLCTIAKRSFRNLMEDAATTPLKTGNRQAYHAQVAGGSEATRYFVSGQLEDESGTLKMPASEASFLREQRGVSQLPAWQLHPSGLRRGSLRTNLSTALGARADLDISAGYVSSNNRLPQVGDNSQGVVDAAVFGVGDPTVPNPWGFYGFVIARPAEGFSKHVERKLDRFTNSATGTWRPWDHITTRAIVGLDHLAYADEATVLRGQGCSICTVLQPENTGLRTLNRFTKRNYTTDLNVTAAYPNAWQGLGFRTAVGVQWTRDFLRSSLATAQELAPGATTIDAGAVKTTGETTTDYRTLGAYVEQQISWVDRVFLTGAVRRDENSSFGRDFRAAYYPKVSASWVVREDDPGAPWNLLRFRAALGESGQQPGVNSAVTFLTPTTATVGGVNVPGVTIGGQGNENLKPERSRELEAGFETGLLRNRVTLDFTYYDKRTRDALVNRTLAGSIGSSERRVENIGVVTNRGVEVAANGRVVDLPVVRWDVNVQASANRNRLKSLAQGIPSVVGFGYQNRPGYPLFGNWWAGKLQSYNDANGDGIIAPDEITVTDTSVYLGSTVPARQLSLTNTVSLFRETLRLSMLVDWRGGYSSFNGGDMIPCLLGTCRALHDKSVSLEEQAKAMAALTHSAFGSYVEDASFARIREASVAYTIPARYAGLLRASSAQLVLTGRNLGLFTGYHDWDPETLQNTIDAFQQYTADGGYNLGQLPQPRTFLVRLNLGF